MNDHQIERLDKAIEYLAFRLNALVSTTDQDRTMLWRLENEVNQLKRELADLRRQR